MENTFEVLPYLIFVVVGALVGGIMVYFGYRLGIGAYASYDYPADSLKSHDNVVVGHDPTNLDTTPTDQVEVPPWHDSMRSEPSNEDGHEWDEDQAQEL